MWLPLLALLLPPGNPSADVTAIQDAIAAVDGRGGFYDREYRRYEPLYWQRIEAWMRRDAAQLPVKKVLDVGCGYGTLLILATQLYGASGYCMDPTDYLKPPTARRFGLTFARGNAELDPIPWSGFDLVLMTEVLEHFNFQPLPTLKKIRAAMKPGAVFFLSTPDARDWGRWTKYYKRLADLPQPAPGRPFVDDHVWIYSEDELLAVLWNAGFRVVHLQYARGNGNRHFNVWAVAQ